MKTKSLWKSGPVTCSLVLLSMTEQRRAINSLEFNQHSRVTLNLTPEVSCKVMNEAHGSRDRQIVSISRLDYKNLLVID